MDNVEGARLWRRAHAYLATRPAQALALGALAAGIGIWLVAQSRAGTLDDPYADPLGVGYPPIAPPEAFATEPVEEAA